jgi:NTP pyrophosphatase (non-canonical NTP hydrolase)
MDLETAMHDAEFVSQRYAKRNGFARTDEWFLLKLQEEVGELTQAYLARSGQGRG